MNKINCNVTKDLLPSYLDKICSEDSKELVENHLAECASCREFLATLQTPDPAVEADTIDYMKKTRLTIETRTLAAVAASLALLVLGMAYGNQHNNGSSVLYYYIEAPALMFVFGALWLRTASASLPKKWECLLPISGTLLTGTALVLRFLATKWATGSIPSPVSVDKLGPFVHLLALLTSWGSSLLLVVLTSLFLKKHRVFLITQNLAWLSINLAMSLDHSLYQMITLESTSSSLERGTIILLAEFIAVTILLFVVDCVRDQRAHTAQK